MISELERELLTGVDREELVSLTRDLVRIDSVIRPESNGTERNVVRFIADWIRRELRIEPLVQEVETGRQNVIATLDSGGARALPDVGGAYRRGERREQGRVDP